MKFKYKLPKVMQIKDCKPGYKYKLEPKQFSGVLWALWVIDGKLYWDGTYHAPGCRYHLTSRECGTYLLPEQKVEAERTYFIITNIYRRKSHAH